MFQTQAEFDSYLAEIAGIEAPDICERVLFKWGGKGEAERHRVDGWYRAIPDLKPEKFADEFDEMTWEICEEGRVERREKGNVRVRPCTREEATHVSITGVGSAVVRLDRIERTHQLIEWPAHLIEEKHKSWSEFYIPHGQKSPAIEVRAR